MVRDLFPVKDSAKVFALLMLVVGVSPMLAPTAGSYVTILFGWHAIFIALIVLGLINLLASMLWLPEKYQPDPSISLLPAPIIKTFLSVIAEPYFYTYALTGAMAFSGLFAYVAGSPVVFMDVFKVSTELYGWIFAILSVGLITASQVNSLLVKRYKSERIVLVALSFQLVLTLCFCAGTYLNLLNLYETIGLLFLFLCCLGFINPNTSALSLSPFRKNAGSASALMGAIQMGVGALASSILSMVETRSAFPMVAVMAGSSVIAMGILLYGRMKLSKTIA